MCKLEVGNWRWQEGIYKLGDVQVSGAERCRVEENPQIELSALVH